MKKFLLYFLCVLILPMYVRAYDFSEGEFSYNILSEEDATVILAKGTAPTKSNHWTLPSSVQYNGKNYTVVEIGERAITNISTRDLAIEIPASIQRIGDYGISSCWYIYWITINDSEQPLYVGKGFLNSCSSLETAEIFRQIIYPDGVWPAFKGKSKLRDVYIRGNYHNINPQEFQSCTALEIISISTPIYSIGQEAFYNTPKLNMFNTYDWDKKYDNIDFVSEMGSGAFEKSGIPFAVIPLGLKEIPSSAFADCINIKSIHFDMYSTNEVIGASAFKGCTNLESVYNYGALKRIDRNAFDGCTSLKRLDFMGTDDTELLFNASTSSTTFFKDAPIEQIYLDRNIVLYNGSISAHPFESNSTLTKVTFGEHCTVLPMALFRYCESLTDINLQYSRLTEIGISCFSGCTGIKGTVRMPESLKIIRTSAFSYCKDIEYVDFNEGLNYLGENSFIGTNIRVVKIPGTVTEMHNAFVDCLELNTCTFDDGSEEIGFTGNPFRNCPLTSLTLGRNIMPGGKTFGEAQMKSVSPFKGNSTLKYLFITDAVTDIPSETFYDCSSLSHIEYYGYSNIETIGRWAFCNCSALTEFTVPSSVISIGDFCFNGCTDLKNLQFASYPRSSQPIKLGIGNSSNGKGFGLFYECPLESVVIGRDLDYTNDRYKYYYSPFYGIETINYVSFSDCVTEVGPYMFENCTGLKWISISPSIKTIHKNAFNGCTGVQNLTLGESVETIDSYAFYRCPLTQIYSSPEIAPAVTADAPVFVPEVYTNANLKIPEGTITSYNTADVWKEFYNVSTMISDDIFVHSISIDKDELSLVPGMSVTLSVTVSPQEAAVKEVVWESSDSSVASVENGIVTAISAGTTIITAMATDGSNVKSECKVVVYDVVTGSTDVDIDDVSVIVENSQILVRNVPRDTVVQLLQANGSINKIIHSNGEDITLCPTEKGVYFVITGSRSHKVIIP